MYTSSPQKNKQFIKRTQSYIAILFVAGIAAYSFFYAPQRAEIIRTPHAYTVFISRDAFDPPIIRVAEGDRVRFVNQDETPHWPASDPHPTHEFLDTFDAREGILPGGSKKFIFPTAGEWSYHDHLSPHRKGAVVVEPLKSKPVIYPDFHPILSWVTTWFSSSVPRITASDPYAPPPEMDELMREKDPRTQAKIVRDMAEKYGPAETLRFMTKSTLPRTGETHLLVHEIGNVAYAHYGNEALRYCDESFLSACYHGVILNALGDHGINGVADTVRQCKDQGIHVFTQCAHAAGHGFLASKNYKVLEALPFCDKLGEIDPHIPLFNCYDGVFMENIFGVHEGKPSPNRMVKKDDPSYPCNAVPEKYQGGCWANQATLMYQLFEGNLKKVAEGCDAVADKDHQQICYGNFARQIHPMTQGALIPAIQLCDNATAAWKDECLITLVGAAFSVGDRTTLPYQICAHMAGTNSPITKQCVETLFGLIASYSKSDSDKSAFCGYLIEEKLREECGRTFGVRVSRPERAAMSDESLDAIKRRIESDGVQAVYTYLKERYAYDPLIAHDLAHLVGRVAYQQLGEHAFAICDNQFAFGCFHGLLEELIRTRGTEALDAARAACNALGAQGAVASCIHGVGHGMYTWKSDVAAALMLCDALAENEKIYCFDGVFMEYYSGSMKNPRERMLATIDDKTWDFCLGFKPQFQSQCVRNHSLQLAYANPDHISTVTAACGFLTGDLRGFCVNSVGLYASQIARGSIEVPEKLCAAFTNTTDRGTCVSAAATEFIFQGLSEKTTRMICDRANTPIAAQCLAAIHRTLELYRPQ